MNDLARIMGLTPKVSTTPTDRLVCSDRSIGTEIEVERVSRAALSRSLEGLWKIVRDDSLRPAEESAELKAPVPGHTGQAFIDAVEALRDLNCFQKGRFSWRTGTHMHIDVRDLDTAQLQRMCVVYQLVEPIFFAWDGKGRQESRFCMPWWICTSDVSAAFAACTDERNTPAYINNFSKYTALNLAPISRQGTVEFRHAQGMGDVDRLVEYANMCLGVVLSYEDDCDTLEIVQDYIMLPRRDWLYRYLPEVTADIMWSVVREGKEPLTPDVEERCLHSALSLAELDGLKTTVVYKNLDLDFLKSLFN